MNAATIAFCQIKWNKLQASEGFLSLIQEMVEVKIMVRLRYSLNSGNYLQFFSLRFWWLFKCSSVYECMEISGFQSSQGLITSGIAVIHTLIQIHNIQIIIMTCTIYIWWITPALSQAFAYSPSASHLLPCFVWMDLFPSSTIGTASALWKCLSSKGKCEVQNVKCWQTFP